MLEHELAPDWFTIHQPLALTAFDRFRSSVAIIHLAVIPTEAEFVAVAVKVLLAEMMERPHHATFQKSEEAFRRVNMRIATRVFALSLINCLMSAIELGSDAAISGPFIGHNRRREVNILADYRLKRRAIDPFDLAGANLANAFYQRYHRRLFGAPTPRFTFGAPACGRGLPPT